MFGADEHGVMRVGETRVMLDSIVAAFQLGHSPETIQQQYPSLTLGEVYGAVAHYLDNQNEVDRYLKRQGEIWTDWRRKTDQCAQPRLIKRLGGQIVGISADDS